jgi:predicted ATPase
MRCENMIKKLYLNNYRAFEEVSLDFSKINLFFGPNNSGKSSLLSSINLLSQTLQSRDSNVSILLNGNLEELGTFRDIVFKNEVKRTIKIGIGVEVEIGRPYRTKEIVKDGYFQVEFKYRPRRRDIVLESTETQIPIGTARLITKSTSPGRHKFSYFDANGEDITDKITRVKRRLSHFIPNFGYTGRFPEKQFKLIRDIFEFNFSWAEWIEEGLEYIGPFRESPERTYLFSGESPDSVGIRGEKAIDMLVMDYLTKGKEKKNIIGDVSKWLNQCDISSNIEVKSLTDRHYEIRLSHSRTGESENLADVGFGCSQILPILIAGFNLGKGQIFIVEQSEIHLHPKAQAELGSFFCDLSKRNIQTFIETHSEHLLLRIQSHIAAGDINPEDVKVYYVFANKETDRKEVEEIKLNKNGTFLTEWPEGFFPERLVEAKKIAKASLKRS